MIDFTKIQTVPVPEPIATLQNTNGTLNKENKHLKAALYISAGIAIGVIVYFMLKKQKEDEAKRRNQTARV
jgi:hypothetical protein